ncbi:MAG: response regulator [Candidatus Gastranaerophilales bacterium]|nr:response regulator [Candidatus Gastranaerophilales bacterium]
MEEKIKVSTEILAEIFKIAKMEVPETITDDNLLAALFKLRNPDKEMSDDIESAQNFLSSDIQNQGTSNNILVVDDIGVVTYQLKVLLKNHGYNVQVAKDIFSGLNTFVKANYAFVIMDLFVSTEQEGYTLLNETKKIITKNNLSTKIVVITASNKAENKVKCLNGGADVFLKKDTGWQEKLIEIVEKYAPIG